MNPSASSCCSYKIKELEALVDDNKSSNQITAFIAITESWLDPHIADAQIHIDGYLVFRCDRDGRGGGVCLYVHESLAVSNVQKYDYGRCQCLIIQVLTINTCVIVVYRPPDADTQSFNAIMRFIKDYINDMNESSQIVLTGDVNFPSIDWSQSSVTSSQGRNIQASATQFLGLLSENLLTQYVNEPTRKSNILDIFCTNNPFLVQSVEVSQTNISDHNIVQITIHIETELIKSIPENQERNGFSALDFSKANYEAISADVQTIDWATLLGDQPLENHPEIINETLLEICKCHVPVRKARTGKPRLLNSLRRKRKRLEARLKKSFSLTEKMNLERELALTFYSIKEAYLEARNKEETSAIRSIKDNPKAFYGYAKKHSQIKRNIQFLKNDQGILTKDVYEISNILQNQFSSVYSDPTSADIQDPVFSTNIVHPLSPVDFTITDANLISAMSELKSNSAPGPDGFPAQLLIECKHALSIPLAIMWRESFRLRKVPECYKWSYVHPLHKKGDRVHAENFRPVSLTSHNMKSAERVVRAIIVDHLDRNNLITAHQHGFRSGRSTLTQLLNHFENILSNIASGNDVDTIYLAYAKAFDKVDHLLLRKKMILYGFPINLVDWISSFLMGRKQRVVVKGVHSMEALVVSGVPQGTVLGPVLFLIFINDLGNKQFESNISFFADDTRISNKIETMVDKETLQRELVEVLEWSMSNNMELNQSKFELLSHTNLFKSLSYEFPFFPELFTYRVSSDAVVMPSGCLRGLGVIVTDDLSWSKHITSLVDKARGVLFWVLSVFKSREKDVMLTLYKSLVRSHLEYCSPLWHPTKIRDIELIESVQREFTRRIVGYQSFSYWERLQILDLWSLQRRRERFIVITMWKVLNKVIPNPNIRFRPPSRLGIQAIIPSINMRTGAVNRTLYDNSFFVVGPVLWNSLPSKLTSIQVMSTFKNQLDILLNTLPDNPPVTGYMRTHTNSLPEVLSLSRRNERSEV